MKPASAFVIQEPLLWCVCWPVWWVNLFSVVFPLTVTWKLSNLGKSRSHYRLCALHCWGYTQSVCGLLKSTQSQLSREPALLSFVTVYACSQIALFKEGAFTSIPHGAGFAFAKAERWLHGKPWESRMIRWRVWIRASPYLLPFPSGKEASVLS